jgi:hypothetical protein
LSRRCNLRPVFSLPAYGDTLPEDNTLPPVSLYPVSPIFSCIRSKYASLCDKQSGGNFLPLPQAKEIGGKLTRREVVTAPGELPVPDSQFATLEYAQMILRERRHRVQCAPKGHRQARNRSIFANPIRRCRRRWSLRTTFHRSIDSGRLKLEWNLDYAAIPC